MKTTKLYALIIAAMIMLSCSIGSVTAAPNVIAWGDDTQTNVPPDLTNAIAISTGIAHSLALTANNTVVGWGNMEPPSEIKALTDIVAISCGATHDMVLRTNGTVQVWGNNDFHQCEVPDWLTNVVKVSAGLDCCVALLSDYSLCVWGNRGTNPSDTNNSTLLNLGSVVDISCARTNYFLVLLDNGTVLSFTMYGGEMQFEEIPPDITKVIAIAASSRSSFALTSSSKLISWGWDQVSIYTMTNVASIAKSSGGIFANQESDYAISSNGVVYYWRNYESSALPIDLPHVSSLVVSPWSSNCMAIISSQALTPPTIIGVLHPTGSLERGSKVVLQCNAIGAPLTYQWYFGTNLLAGEIDSQLTLTNIQAAQSGQYTVVASNNLGMATSLPVTINVLTTINLMITPTIVLHSQIGDIWIIQWKPFASPTNDVWTDLVTVTITNIVQVYTDLTATNQTSRQYRLQLQE